MLLPPVRDAVASKSTGVVAEAQVQVPEVALQVVQAVRIDDAPGGAGEIVVQGFLGDAGIKPAESKEKPQKFLVFGVDADDEIRRFHELVTIAGNDLKLPILAEMFSKGKGFERFAMAQAMAFEKLGHDGHAHPKTRGPKPLGDLNA